MTLSSVVFTERKTKEKGNKKAKSQVREELIYKRKIHKGIGRLKLFQLENSISVRLYQALKVNLWPRRRKE
jgi:hypothetical protein